VCYCSQGYYGFQCSTALQKKCYVNITSPAFYKRCEKEDTPEYMYSIPGFDPCYPLDFSKKQVISFVVSCRYFDDTNTVNVRSENVGYAYRDVMEAPENPGNFSYIASNPRFQYKIVKQTDMKVRFSMFNWKWLSEIYPTEVTITEPNQLAGLEEVQIELDFPFLEK
jgi:hypothetical protein